MRGVFEKVQACLKHIIAYEDKTLDHRSAGMGSLFLCALFDELQDEICDRAGISYPICGKDGHGGENR